MTKKQENKRSFLFKCSVVLCISFLSWLIVGVVVGSINTSLTIDIQRMNDEIAALKSSTRDLNIEIQTLENKDRIYTIAIDAGLKPNQDNVINTEISE